MDNQQQLSRGATLWMTALVGLISAPHLSHLPGNIVAFFLAVLAIRVAIASLRWREVPVWLLGMISIAGFVLVVTSFGALLGRGPGVALLVTTTVLKLLELRSRRDVIMLSFLGYFLAATQFLYSQTIGISVAMAIATLALTATLIHVHQARGYGFKLPAKTALRLFAQALPMMLVLYIIFPRTGPIWQLGVDTDTAITGLSDTLEPGSIANLVQSKSTAFTVKFTGDIPANRDRYFRGPIFETYDGKRWQAAKPKLAESRRIIVDDEYAVTQEIVMEPSGQHYLFALETPIDLPLGAKRTVAGQLVLNKPIREQQVYSVRSAGGIQGARPRAHLLDIPELSPSVARLAASLKRNTPEATINAVLDHFGNGEFVYSLTPGKADEQRLEHFLFESKKGFCEHYASSYVILLRANGIHARVVGGYQGGEWNPVGEVLKVRQADAHAWTEVWLPDTGWQRIDPTAVVSPERVEQTVNVVDGGDGARISFSLDLSGLKQLWQQASWLADDVRFHWRLWVVDFDENTQKELWEALGLQQLSSNHVILLGFGIITSLLIIGAIWSLRGTRRSALDRLRIRVQQLARRTGIDARNSDGTATLVAKLATRYPAAADVAGRFAEAYVNARYRAMSPRALGELRQLLSQLEKHVNKPAT